jgi:hypothetical protein
MTDVPNTTLIRVIALVPAVMLVLAVFQMPYGFYTLLRLVVTIAAAVIAWHAVSKSEKPIWAVLMGLIALLFNPIVPVYLTREIWFFIDLVVAATFVSFAVTQAKR